MIQSTDNDAVSIIAIAKAIRVLLVPLIWFFGMHPVLGSALQNTTTTNSATSANSLLERGEHQLDTGADKDAEKTFAQLEQLATYPPSVFFYRSKALIHLKQYSDAESELQKFLKLKPDSADATYLLGYIQFLRDDPKSSLATYTAAAKLSHPTSDDLKIVGLDYGLLNDIPDAIHWLSIAIQYDPKNLDAVYYLGRAYYQQNKFPAARKSFLYVLRYDPRHVRAENGLGLIYEATNQPGKAIEAYNNAIEWNRSAAKPSEQPLMNLAMLLLDKNQPEKSLLLLQFAQKIQPNDPMLPLDYGRTYMALGRWQDAERELQQAIQHDPKNSKLHYLLGRAYQRDGKTELSQTEFQTTRALLGTRSNSVDDSVKSMEIK